jgi:hypothetical protein
LQDGTAIELHPLSPYDMCATGRARPSRAPPEDAGAAALPAVPLRLRPSRCFQCSMVCSLIAEMLCS